jgi:hypothetical protein
MRAASHHCGTGPWRGHTTHEMRAGVTALKFRLLIARCQVPNSDGGAARYRNAVHTLTVRAQQKSEKIGRRSGRLALEEFLHLREEAR